jgi:hypothetical protein
MCVLHPEIPCPYIIIRVSNPTSTHSNGHTEIDECIHALLWMRLVAYSYETSNSTVYVYGISAASMYMM